MALLPFSLKVRGCHCSLTSDLVSSGLYSKLWSVVLQFGLQFKITGLSALECHLFSRKKLCKSGLCFVAVF